MWVFVLLTLAGLAVTDGATLNPPDNRGTEFVLTFMENFHLGSNKIFPLELYVTTQENRTVNVHVTTPKWTSPKIDVTFTVTSGTVRKVDIDNILRMSGNELSGKGVLVTADADIVVYGANKEDYSNDVYLGLPTDAIGTDYYAVTHGPATLKAELAVAATADGTTVRITLPKSNGPLLANYGGVDYKEGDTVTVKMDKYQTFQLQSAGDLTGARIESDKPVAAFSGNIKTNIGTGTFQDHLVEQLMPANTWGEMFVTAPIPRRTTGDVFKVIARENNTVVNISGHAPIHLNAGEWKQFELPSDKYSLIRATNPVLLAQFVKSQQRGNEPADPSMIIIPPYEQFSSDYTFTTPEYSHPEFGTAYPYRYLNEFMVVTKTSEKDGLLLDGRPFPTTTWSAIPGTDLSGAYITVPSGPHTVRHSNPLSIFGGYLYGHAYHESYGFPTGMKLAVIYDKNCKVTTPVPGDGIDNDCDNRVDEELCTPDNMRKDDDGDGLFDEDCIAVSPIDGFWTTWSPWGSMCSVTCDNGVYTRTRNCSAPAPKFGGKPCPGNDTETKPCYGGAPCPLNIASVCVANQTSIVASPVNCAQYYDCSRPGTLGQPHLFECPYPQLFNPVSLTCEPFERVNCSRKHEPMAPCEYEQNKCNGSDPTCTPCPKRLTSCVGDKDGKKPVSVFSPSYVVCYKNRTMSTNKCKLGYFNPQAQRCMPHMAATLGFYCRSHPHELVGHPGSCAKYYDCSVHGRTLQDRTRECTYPDLFSLQTGQCENFTTVDCISRPEPQAPCEYDQNICPATNHSCQPCPQRHSDCRGLGNGTRAFQGREWGPDHVYCLLNRTLIQDVCPHGYFHPVQRKCMDTVKPNEVNDVCKANPTLTFTKADNCAQLYNCSLKSSSLGNFVQECKYPDLYSAVAHTCDKFESVDCKTRTEPQAPCEYKQNLCNAGNTTCKPCPNRLPSCVGLPDGNHPFPARNWKPDYMVCYKNRTMDIKTCPSGYFHPNMQKCVKNVARPDAPAYCAANPTAIVPTPGNCAQYFNCSRAATRIRAHVMECKYPDLFSTKTLACQPFETVSCDKRPEPEAPCEYDQNLCNKTNPTCTVCPRRLPTCVGQTDGDHVFPGRMWKPDYITCYKNRTMNITQCQHGYFHPTLGRCETDVNKPDAPAYCAANPTAIISIPGNCAQYYNCSQAATRIGAHVMECKYPDLFSTFTHDCRDFQTVTCDKRHEPQAPCEYDQNICNATTVNCAPCPDRLPSCIGVPDGDQPFPHKLWTASFIHCYKNRTLTVDKCPAGAVFDLQSRKCSTKIQPGSIDAFCKANPRVVKASPDNCAQYIDCARPTSPLGHYIRECRYPDLYSPITHACQQFESVDCKNRTEPQAPCQYMQNKCAKGNSTCEKCPNRLPSCIGLSDGNHPFPTRLWKPDYVVCYKNRTIDIKTCSAGYFHPNMEVCTKTLDRPDAVPFCAANPSAILPTTDNCGQYYNCSDPTSHIGGHVVECKYPDLFSTLTHSCERFESVTCDRRMEPQAPCQYKQNLCQKTTPGCKICPERLPSCIGLPDGNHPFPSRLWKPDYISCYKNRTVDVTQCHDGFFHPNMGICTKDLQRPDAVPFCAANPSVVLPTPDNCGQYYNCSDPTSHIGGHVVECKYPDLFSTLTMMCDDFTKVTCDKRPEPQAPCEYDSNLCSSGTVNCVPCPDRLPSCRGLTDGDHPFPTKLWTDSYIHCYKNRTLTVDKCPAGSVFDPQAVRCVSKIPAGNIDVFCRANPTAMKPQPANCAQYYNCSNPTSKLGHYLVECRYPDLYSAVTRRCERFESVQCDNRTEPMAPCQYLQNHCNTSTPHCLQCLLRLPSCVGLPDGNHTFLSRRWAPDYITCYKNRTVAVQKCATAYFHPNMEKCTTTVDKPDAKPYCSANPTQTVPTPDNCAQFYNCSAFTSGATSTPVQECAYPNLFSSQTLSCHYFTAVHCGNKVEPQAPCDYAHNICNATDPACSPCPERLPSCVGLPDGVHPFPTRLWKPDFMTCYKNRTVAITKCQDGYFHPKLRGCKTDLDRPDAPAYCAANPTAIIPTPGNCAQYYNCSQAATRIGAHVIECKYPDLFSTTSGACEAFTTVVCHRRPEPQAPCQYDANICGNSDPQCLPCPQRLPSCVGQPDGYHVFTGRSWMPNYIVCFHNRTVNVTRCKDGYFHPNMKMCVKDVKRPDAVDYCAANPSHIVPTPDNCAQYYNCSDPATPIGGHVTECRYPDLFSTRSMMCEEFTKVTCDKRLEPQAPCEYDQNVCPRPSPTTCQPCPQRLPSCIGQTDGDRPFLGQLWTASYVTCFKNRTIAVDNCPAGAIFDTKQLHCVTKVPTGSMDAYCKANPRAIKVNPANCAQFYDCSTAASRFGKYLVECTYPDLFSAASLRCEKFETVTCHNRTEPQAPCDYMQNICSNINTTCKRCPLRLPSCIGLPDGNHAFPGRQWKPDYISCYRNRTVGIHACTRGYFHPATGHCREDLPRTDANQYCQANPHALLPTSDNCAQYFNCTAFTVGAASSPVAECRYPDLFSLLSMSCQHFTTVSCGVRKEPQAPCEYNQNHCLNSDPSCVACRDRLPSCVGSPDGSHLFPTRLWSPDYVTCYKNRTIEIKQCPNGFFHPVDKTCQTTLRRPDANHYCKSHPHEIIPIADNCAQFFNCSRLVTGVAAGVIQECQYPDLFHVGSLSCRTFTSVTCLSRPEPQAPCEYNQNICPAPSQTCTRCPLRLPSCVGLADGSHAFPSRLWKPDYIVCYKNRTVEIKTCIEGYFHPTEGACKRPVSRVDAKSFCEANPTAVEPTQDNCAQFYNCRRVLTGHSGYVEECPYPDLYSTLSRTCQDFTTVTCDSRSEPQAPCQYKQNVCPVNDHSCQPCPDRLSSCIGQADGHQPFIGKPWTSIYVRCYRNRTMAIHNCPNGAMFDPHKLLCVSKITPGDIDDFCRSNPRAVKPHAANCAQFYNCSRLDNRPQFSHHLQECPYPDLFSSVTQRCENFETVQCDARHEPQPPCEYLHNLCSTHDQSCVPCDQRLPSCVGRPDGPNAIPNHLWSRNYVQCYKNRTMGVKQCQARYFHPVTRTCTDVVNRGDLKKFCGANPGVVVEAADNCAVYYNCSNTANVDNRYVGMYKDNRYRFIYECDYPDLFSVTTLTCMPFETVTCGVRPEPYAPCEYEKNLCDKSAQSCTPCPDRLPSCVGLPNGAYTFRPAPWTERYIECYMNRTVAFPRCNGGYFHPRHGRCMTNVDPVDVPDYCAVHPNAILPHPDNCAKFYNCSSPQRGYEGECRYPSLYSPTDATCREFTSVICGSRLEPQAPCEYDQNLCHSANCVACPDRLPSCVGLADGVQPRPGRLWMADYIECYRNRTVSVTQCQMGVFHPTLKACVQLINTPDIPAYCVANPSAIVPSPDNCAQYYNCSEMVGHTISVRECRYPNLFSTSQLACVAFTQASCSTRMEPQAPCDYTQNLCPPGNTHCAPCPEHHPSCVGQSDGVRAFTGREWTAYYMTCYKNRTMTTSSCPIGGVFDPDRRACVATIDTTEIHSYCRYHPNTLREHPDNCAQYFDCSKPNSPFGPFLMECKYPSLFSPAAMKCVPFIQANCGSRKKPIEPCQYLQNLCTAGNLTCEPCTERLPSCVGKSDGQQPFPTQLWMEKYIVCFQNRTISVGSCTSGYFNPRTRICSVNVEPGADLTSYCRVHTTDIVVDAQNCAHYFNCSSPSTALGGYQTECRYPELYSPQSRSCQSFETIDCQLRPEPKAPCEYENVQHCDTSSASCSPCPQRRPSCVGKPDGHHGFPGRQWKPDYLVCYKNRTISMAACAQGYSFNPRTRTCECYVLIVDIFTYCQSNPTSVVPSPDNCAQYYDCSALRSAGVAAPVSECSYPDLFSGATRRCETFENVQCEKRQEPMAPCQYAQNVCQSGDPSCQPCSDRLPSCIGLSDGHQVFNNQPWTPRYVTCYKNRTLTVGHCTAGAVFNPRQQKCVSKFHGDDLRDFCRVNPSKILPHPTNCAQYYNCAYVTAARDHRQECTYPDLFDRTTLSCRPFSRVQCGVTYEPQAPCEYMQNRCDQSSSSCLPCPVRLPSCISLADGQQPFPGHLWQANYIVCHQNRTVDVSRCSGGQLFNPVTLQCVDLVPKPEVRDFCTVTPNAIVPDVDDCSRYYNCSAMSMSGDHHFQCAYPNLFSSTLKACVAYSRVQCGARHEPKDPCDYDSNICHASATHCVPCRQRLPSCVGLPDGLNGILGQLWSVNYVICYLDHTIQVQRCGKGVFDPNTRLCSEAVDPSNIARFCAVNPQTIVAHPTNCAQYFSCANIATRHGNYLHECSYPALFDKASLSCKTFTDVQCGARREPQAPCDYQQNLCPNGTSSCDSCEHRHPSCVGRPDGENMVPSHPWSREYVVCSRNRTTDVRRCREGYFDPRQRVCVRYILQVDIVYFCKTNRGAVMADVDNCGRYYNCSSPAPHSVECPYPALFSEASGSCSPFSTVFCGARHQPQTPCEYQNNLCDPSDKNCQPCSERLPSCRGLPDGINAIVGRIWSRNYINCLQNRTIEVKYCVQGLFDPRTKQCTSTVDPGSISDICRSNPRSVFPDPTNCARYYDCQSSKAFIVNYVHECSYPALFSHVTSRCEHFTSVTCASRMEPQAPCEYSQNLCQNMVNCIPCRERLPSCVGLRDGDHPMPGQRWGTRYIACYRNRTVNVLDCTEGWFDPLSQTCVKYVPIDHIGDFCKSHPSSVLPNGRNAAQFLDCTWPGSNLLPRYLRECTYPDLFDVRLARCVEFTKADTGNRPVPQAPCDYIGNLCKLGDSTCIPCSARLYSCVLLPDGYNAIEGRAWGSDYVNCYHNRTLGTGSCGTGVFDPSKRQCVVKNTGTFPDVCQLDPSAIIPHPGSCALYYNCSATSPTFASPSPPQLQECTYPHLYSPQYRRCFDFQTVHCGERNEVMSPCQYLQNHCRPGSVCRPCPERLPSCVGLLDGDNAIAGRYWTRDYVHCYRNRTVTQQTCQEGYFHPYSRRCMDMLQHVDVRDYCHVHSTAVVPSSENCAGYHNCSLQARYHGTHGAVDVVSQECRYPALFSSVTHRCESFVNVNCGTRHEPQAPCEYSENACVTNNSTCVPCTTKLPSCVGLPNGYDAIPGREYTDMYLDCYLNRTLQVKTCDFGFFDPGVKICVTQINSGNIAAYCKRNPFAVLAHPTNCAWYYNCSVAGLSPRGVYPFDTLYVQECPYPSLFSTASMTCEAFTRVTCGRKFEPQAPCEYYKNRCDPTLGGCIPCPNRIPSCKALPDGDQTITNLYDGVTYLVHCLTNRTMSYHACIGDASLCGVTPPSTEAMTVQTTASTQSPVRYTGPTLPPGIVRVTGDIGSAPPTVAVTVSTPIPVVTMRPTPTTTGYVPASTPQPASQMYGLCAMNRGRVLRNPLHCGQYYDCSRVAAPYLFECPYPQLFSDVASKCEQFLSVSCNNSPEYMTPCSYQQNICDQYDPSCVPCEDRLPSCLGLGDGNQPFPDRLWRADYITCYRNRTIFVGTCPPYSVFDPNRGACLEQVTTATTAIPGLVTSELCKNDPYTVKPHPLNCAQYVDCTVTDYLSLDAIRECEYPKLFSPLTLRCEGFETMHCGPRHEPKAPCEYLQNLCAGNQPDCIPCVERLPSCIGMPDGYNAVANRTRSSDYVRCYKERTLEVKKCPTGFVFDSYLRKCAQATTAIPGLVTSELCKNDPYTVKPHPLNCAQYVDCTVTDYLSLDAIRECEYPKLFSPLTLRCEAFDTMHCGPRHEPKAPCEYLQNLCAGNQPDCISCVERLPSCIGMPDGYNAVANRTRSSDYVRCYKERTLEVKKCPTGFVFDSYLRKCAQDDIGTECHLLGHTAMFANPQHCAQYYDCDQEKTTLGHHLQECPYPQLFDKGSRSCRNGKDVQCGQRQRPNSRCDYQLYECIGANCQCTNTDPTCTGRPDGLNPYPGRELTGYYIVCENGRVIEEGICILDKILDPVRRICTNPGDQEIIDAYCIANPGTTIASLTDCAQYYECGHQSSAPLHTSKECPYPQLFSMEESMCRDFADVGCGQRDEPISPCEYYKNRCDPTLGGCIPCPNRIPSCKALPDGDQTITNLYDGVTYLVHCLTNRTMSYHACIGDASLCGVTPPSTEAMTVQTTASTQSPVRYTGPTLPPGIVRVTGDIGSAPPTVAVTVSTPIPIVTMRPTPTTTGYVPASTPQPASQMYGLCAMNRGRVLRNPLHCGQYYDCSRVAAPYLFECPYPQLFSDVTSKCEQFLSVSCNNSPEYMTPCSYQQNICDQYDPSCVPCEDRLPSCLGLGDGNQPFPDRLWRADYITCYRNRTIFVGTCPPYSVFDPNRGACLEQVTTATTAIPGLVTSELCKNDPYTVKPHPLNCAQYVDCTVTDYLSLDAIRECEYPKLFSPLTLRCEGFETMHCGPRHEPKAPCEYLQNLCVGNQPDCIPCVERLPSCIGMPDGYNAVANRTRSSDYVRCYKERTLEVKKCPTGFVFDSYLRKCAQDDIGTECHLLGHTAMFANPQHCAQYYDCDQEKTTLGHHLQECPYPQLFDKGSRSCRNGKDVQCGQRQRPNSRCDYQLYECIGANCQCTDTDPTCTGRPDGLNPYPGRELTGYYIVCENGRVIEEGICILDKILDPVRRICTNPGDQEIIDAYCFANPGTTIASLTDCAQYYECGHQSSAPLHTSKECPYPQLFSMEESMCRDFADVGCGQRDEPISPCDYAQYQCDATDPACVPCNQRMPSCVGLVNGRHALPGQYGRRSAEYLVCEGSRTVDIARCWTGYFEPQCNLCVSSDFGTLPALPNADVCNENLVSGSSPVPDHSITASSMYGIHELMHRYGPDRSRLNNPEVKDAQGVTHMGGWVAEQSDLNQWIQVELTAPSLVRGITTQGRNGGYKQWVEKFRVLYSTDSHCRKWTTVGGFNVTDTFFKANNDEDSTVTNMFHCPVIARCIRVNPLAWTNYIALRLELIGCSLNTGPSATKSTAASTTTTKAPVITTGALKSTKVVAQLTTPKPGTMGGLKGCLKSCKGMPNGDYQSCKSCDRYVTCNWGSMFPDRPCSKGLKWDANKKSCQFRSTTCP